MRVCACVWCMRAYSSLCWYIYLRIMEELKFHNEKVINDEDEFSNTGLHKAAENGHLKAIKLLTQWGAVKDARYVSYPSAQVRLSIPSVKAP